MEIGRDEENLVINDGDDLNNLNDVSATATDIDDDDQYLTLCGKSLNVTWPQLVTIVLLTTYYLLTSSYYSLLAPFLPGEAVNKGLTKTQIGIIFSVFELVLLVLTPFFGKYLQVFGIRFLFVSGIFLSSGSEILFGFLDMCPNGFVFFAMCVACRVVTAIGSSMGLSYAIVGHYFPNKISSIVAFLEVFNGLGLMIGPVLGGFLFELGGFRFPFFFMGGLLFLTFILAFFMFPEPKRTHAADQATLPLLPMLKIPRFLFTLLILFVASTSIGFMEPSIQLHLSPLNLRPVQLGLILFFPSLLYMIATPIVGYLSDKYVNSMPIFLTVGSIVSGVAYSFFGPIPFYNLPLKLWIFLVGFIVYGLSIGVVVIPVYSELTKIVMKKGYPNDLRTQGLVSGLFGSTWSLGALVGPLAGGYAVELIGFEWASFGVVCLFISTSVIYITYHLYKLFKPTSRRVRLEIGNYLTQDDVERDPLLSDTS